MPLVIELVIFKSDFHLCKLHLISFSESHRLVRLPLAPRKVYIKTVIRKATWRQRWQLVKHGLLGRCFSQHNEEAKKVGMRVIDNDGLLGMNIVR